MPQVCFGGNSRFAIFAKKVPKMVLKLAFLNTVQISISSLSWEEDEKFVLTEHL